MPLVRIADQLHHFAHVPKCGGSSVSNYLAQRFGSLAFRETDWSRVPWPQRNFRTSLQHLEAQAIDMIFPDGWISSIFAVVRNPYHRFLSAFNFRSFKGLLPVGTTPEEWLADYELSDAYEPHAHYNFLRNQSDMVPKNAVAFCIEDGLGDFTAHLDKLAGTQAPDCKILHRNKAVGEIPKYQTCRPLSKKVLSSVKARYAPDFERFGYDDTPPEGLIATVTTTAPDHGVARNLSWRRNSPSIRGVRRGFRRLKLWGRT